MLYHGYPRLCGGTFFTLILQALKQRVGAREGYLRESDGMSEPEVLMGLFRVVNPDFQYLDKKTLKSATDGFKSCKAKSNVYLPYGDTQEVRAFDSRVKTQYAEVLRDMEGFVDHFIDTGEKIGNQGGQGCAGYLIAFWKNHKHEQRIKKHVQDSAAAETKACLRGEARVS